MIALEAFFTNWLGSATAIGAASWLHAFTWIATLIAAIIAGVAAIVAGVSLRRNTLQNRATLILALYNAFGELAKQRRDFAAFHQQILRQGTQDNPKLKGRAKIEKIRLMFHEDLLKLKQQDDPRFIEFTAYVSYFEILGIYLKNGYVPMRDIVQIFKGPILDVNNSWRQFIATWQKEPDMEKGLLENAIFLMDMMRVRASHPIYYWMIYRFVRRYW
jgi:hypothetical protein